MVLPCSSLIQYAMLSNSFNLYHFKQTTVIFKLVEIRQNQDFISHSFIPSIAFFLYRDLRFLKENCNRTFNKNKEEFKTIAIGVRDGNGTPLQHSCLENPMDGGAWWAIVQRVAKSWTRLNDFIFNLLFRNWKTNTNPTPSPSFSQWISCLGLLLKTVSVLAFS